MLGALSLTVSNIIVKIFGLIYKIPLVHLLGDVGMGYFNTAYTVYTCFYLLCNAGVPKAIAILTARPDMEGAVGKNTVLRVALSFFLLFGGGLTLVFFLLALPLSRAVGNPGAGACMFAIAPSVLFVALAGVIKGYFNGLSRLWPIALSGVIEGGGRLGFGWMLIRYGIARQLPLTEVCALGTAGTAIASLVSLLYLVIELKFSKTENKREQNKSFQRKDVLGNILRIAIPITLSSGIMSVTNLLDLGMIMRRLESIGYTAAEASGVYGNYTTLVIPMFNVAAALITPVCMAALPGMSRQYADGNRAGFVATVRKTLALCGFFLCPLALGCLLYPREILSVIYPVESAKAAAPLLSLISPAMVLLGILTVLNTALEASGYPRAPLYSLTGGAIVKLVVGFLLIGNDSFGILGAPIGTCVTYAVGVLISAFLFFRRIGSPVPVLRALWLPMLNAAAAILCAELTVKRLFSVPDGQIAFFLVVLSSALYYFPVSCLDGAIPRDGRRKWLFFTKKQAVAYEKSRKNERYEKNSV